MVDQQLDSQVDNFEQVHKLKGAYIVTFGPDSKAAQYLQKGFEQKIKGEKRRRKPQNRLKVGKLEYFESVLRGTLSSAITSTSNQDSRKKSPTVRPTLGQTHTFRPYAINLIHAKYFPSGIDCTHHVLESGVSDIICLSICSAAAPLGTPCHRYAGTSCPAPETRRYENLPAFLYRPAGLPFTI